MTEYDLAQLGLAGIVIVAMARAIYILWQRNVLIQDQWREDKARDSERYQKIVTGFTKATEAQNRKLERLSK